MGKQVYKDTIEEIKKIIDEYSYCPIISVNIKYSF
jgi:hypothetical protein